MWAALQLEKTWSKQQILESYLNLVSYRGELQGVSAATQALFGNHPSGLSEAEASVLAAMLPAPNADAGRIARRACAIARAAAAEFDCHILAGVADAALNRARAPTAGPNLTPHLAQQFLHTPGQTLRTTLDATLQRRVLDILRQQLSGLAELNVRDGAALVVDNVSGEVLAYVGSAGPRSKSPQVDGIRARRQAGSTLKPFLYGLAIEKRYLTAASILEDAPLNLETASGLYIPQNYDRDFKGLVSARTALAGSLNIPAIRVLMLVGVERFRDRLRAQGYEGIKRAGEYYGYSLALGSAEVSLLEQVTAFRSLAEGGIVRPLRFLPDAPEVAGHRVSSSRTYSPTAAGGQ
jgi:penicillin-binding protein 1C